jgi:RND family efflux transporter MFP subunit
MWKIKSRSRMIWKHTGVAAALGIVALAIGCNRESAVQNPLTPVRVVAAGTYEDVGGLRYSANIEAFTQVNLAFKSGGYVDYILERKGADGRMRVLQLGDRVAHGEILARVREKDYVDRVASAKAQLAQAQAAFDKSQLDFDRASSLLASDSMTKAQYDAAKASYESSAAGLSNTKAGLQSAETALSDCSLRSPLDGWIMERDVEIGTLAGTGTQGFIVADVHLVKAVFGIPDTAVQSTKLGAPQTITTSSFSDEFRGRITAVSPSADPKSRVFSVEVTIPNADNRLKPGMVATITLTSGKPEKPATVVPLSSVVRSTKRADAFAVFVIEDQSGKSVARERVVEIGDTFGNMISVMQGLKAGERVVEVGGTQIRDGEVIQVLP